MRYVLDWSVLWRGQSGERLPGDLVTTLDLSALAWLLAAVLGTLHTVRLRPLRILAACYVEFFRNVPRLVRMLFRYEARLGPA